MSVDWGKVGSTIGSFAPLIGGVIGGPGGAAIGGLVSKVLGVEESPEAVLQELKGNPEAQVKILELQENSKVELQRLSVEQEANRMRHEESMFKISTDDAQSARDMALRDSDDWVRPATTVIMLLGALFIVALVFLGDNITILTDPTSATLVGLVIGYWFNELKSVVGFWFGNHKESLNQKRNSLFGFKKKDK